MELKPTNFDITWFLDQNEQNRLDLDPPYQRKSVWTLKDRRFFLDTIFRGYPSPPIYLHKDTNDEGKTIWHVVDGKQRLKTILDFANPKSNIRLGMENGDTRLDGKRWRDLAEFPDLRKRFWDYTFPVQVLPQADTKWIQEVFDRLNRSSKNLDRQELRHAKFEGWLIKFVEAQAETNTSWSDLKVVTKGRARRMRDVQFISELASITIKKKMQGFNQDELDDMYADYDYPEDEDPDFNFDSFQERFSAVLNFIQKMNEVDERVCEYTKTFMHAYTIWAVVDLEQFVDADVNVFTKAYIEFMERVDQLKIDDIEDGNGEGLVQERKYLEASKGANTELPQRSDRYDALVTYFRGVL